MAPVADGKKIIIFQGLIMYPYFCFLYPSLSVSLYSLRAKNPPDASSPAAVAQRVHRDAVSNPRCTTLISPLAPRPPFL